MQRFGKIYSHQKKAVVVEHKKRRGDQKITPFEGAGYSARRRILSLYF